MEAVKHKTKYRFEQLAGSPGAAHKLYVYDDVSSTGEFNWETWDYEESETSAKYFRGQLDMIPDGEPIELHVNSRGGEVGEGVAIYNLLRQKAGNGSRLVGYVDGMAYSVAMDIILACDEVHMGLGTSMFLHNPWIVTSGGAEELRSMADQLDALADASRQLYLSRAKGLSEDELRQMMQKETMLSPNDCLKYGFCDFVDGAADQGGTGAGQEQGAVPMQEQAGDGVGVSYADLSLRKVLKALQDEQDQAGNSAGNSIAGKSLQEVLETLRGAYDQADESGHQSAEQLAKELKNVKEEAFRQRQLNEMLRGLMKPSMQETLHAAFRQMAGEP